MKHIEIRIVIVFFSLFFLGCQNPDDNTEIAIEPAGGSYYYIKNQTDLDLYAQFPVPTYDRSIDKMIDLDSTVIIPRLATTKLFEDLGNFGLNPTPTHTFKNIKFFKQTDGLKTLVLEINPVKNDRWISTILSREEYGYGLTEYLLVLGKEDL